jgi:hypothetical protein
MESTASFIAIAPPGHAFLRGPQPEATVIVDS